VWCVGAALWPVLCTRGADADTVMLRAVFAWGVVGGF
jgi:hypothetical protein